jgi:Terminase large subunit, T4likevirus-type, N-terminal
MTADLRRSRDDLEVFSSLIGRPLRPYQVEALECEVRTTVVAAPRQTGKSYSLANLSLHRAYRKPRQRVLIVSAGEEASKRLLAEINTAATHPILKGSVLADNASLLMLSNGSEIRSVPASERQIRGWSVDLLIVDEAAYVSEDVLLGAALPTTAARPDARIVLVSTPWAMEGAFYRFFLAGRDRIADSRSFQWRLKDAPWITDEVVEAMRATLPPLRFRAEFEGEFVGASDALFPPGELLAAVAPYRLLTAEEARGEEIVVGVDWGRAFDSHAVVAVGLLDDYGANAEPILFVPWLETSQRPYSQMVAAVASLARRADVRRLTFDPFYSQARPIKDRLPGGGTLHENGSTLPRPVKATPGYSVRSFVTEMNGVGAMPSEELSRLLGRRVMPLHTSQRSKEDAYSRLRALLMDRRIVLPDEVDLLRQLQGLSYAPTGGGGLSIEASDPNVHDDLADALSLAVSAIPHDTRGGVVSPEPEGVEWLETSGGVRVPAAPRPRKRGSFNRAGRRFQTF